MAAAVFSLARPTAYFSSQSGGYFPGAPALVAAELLVLTAAYLALARRPIASVGPALLISAAALGAFAAWALSRVGGLTRPPAPSPSTRARSVIWLRWCSSASCLTPPAASADGLRPGAAIVAVCAVSFLSRTAPDLVSGMGGLQSDRLSYPLDYWNALGLLAGLGIILMRPLRLRVARPLGRRVAGAAACRC